MKIYNLIAMVAFLVMALGANAQNIQNSGESSAAGSHSVYVTGGYSHIYSHVQSRWTSGDPRLGWDWQAGYDWISSRGWGAGFLYSGYIATGKEYGGMYTHADESMMLNYFAPQGVYHWSRPGSRWDFFVKAGLGFIMITERAKLSTSKRSMSATKCGLGSNLTLGTEFKISRRFGVTASLSGVNAFIHQDNSAYDMPDGNGMARISLNLGVKLHL